ncbi:hypothetical protein [Pseudacidovorax sp. RU35E]|uniref:hypothetical protein n=1 Tax=Pseudacidovorax sp. RU35E TaxID=1907403 RepID=UPI000956470F|nr:hypothetical protein [Pseudacidovorax sp. RU35E]SIR00330.1 hypothetical protein SAMN05880557_10792 [Pseudacidovorax sp. RU35E]
MRPAGEVSQALLQAAAALATEERAPTQRELAMKAQVGFTATRLTIKNLVRAGHLVRVRARAVAYCNKPVAEYAPPRLAQRGSGSPAELGRVLAGWGAAA